MVRAFIAILIIAGMNGCGGGITGTGGIADYDALIKSGWDEYNRSNYDEAQRLFNQAKDYDELRPEGYIGSGWTLLRRQHPDSAIVAFRTSFDYIASLEDSVDTIAGLSGSYLAAGENSSVINLFNKYEISSYEDAFPLKDHDFSLDSGDLEIVQAMALYRLGVYSSTDQPDPDNATYHLNQALFTPYDYTGPESLMEDMTKYLNRSSVSYY